ncbi:WAT1-related protein At3g30340-like [Hibiscus syriacus]|uniref:WAT1-related protein At3g30340-like n=1 Tax=Hibiscus syriacus TaxID=106335 RepID=UPI0019243651|nr:WAT1-related protein At3g30340-like [Hibiscus syriacus]
MEDCNSYQLRSGHNEFAYQKDSRWWHEPYSHHVYRQAISAVSLAPVVYFWERKTRSKLTAGVLCQLSLDAVTGATLCLYSFLLGLEYTSSTFTCAFINMVPAITFTLALPFGLEKVNLRNKAGVTKVIGTLVCIDGAVVLTLYKGKTLVGLDSGGAVHAENYADPMVSSKNKKERWAIGSVFLAAGTVFLSSLFVPQTRIGTTYPCQYSSTAILSFFSAIQSAIISLITERDFTRWILKGRLELLSVAYSGMVGSGLCYVGLSWSVKQKGPVFTSTFTLLVQIFVAIFDFSILHGQIYFGSVIGSILVVIGLYILLWGRNREAEQTQQLKQTQIEERSN